MNERRKIIVDQPGDVWFFAYGSLMWDPGFRPAEVRPALLHGWHRRFCVASAIYRGTPEAARPDTGSRSRRVVPWSCTDEYPGCGPRSSPGLPGRPGNAGRNLQQADFSAADDGCMVRWAPIRFGGQS